MRLKKFQKKVKKMSVDVPTLYEICLRLEENGAKNTEDFQRCIDAVKDGDISTRKLAIQIVFRQELSNLRSVAFIIVFFRFFDTFPDKRVSALNTLLSQLNEPDVEVQKIVIKGLPTTCQKHADYVDQVQKIVIKGLPTTCQKHADYVDQVNPKESLLVRKSLSTLLVSHPKETVVAMYGAINDANTIEEKVTMLRFMDEKVSRLLKAELTPLMKKKLSEIYKEMLISSTPDEIEIILRFMGKATQIKEEEKLTIFKEALDELVDKGITFEGESATDSGPDFISIVNNVVKVVLILNSAGRSYKMPRKMTNYLFSKFGKMRLIHASDRKDILKVLASVTHLGNYEDPDDFSCVIKLFDYLRSMLPNSRPIDPDAVDGYVDQVDDQECDIEFAELELVFIVLFNLLKRHRFIAEELMAVGDIWKPKLQYLVNVIRVFTQRLKRKLDEESGNGEEHSKDTRLLLVANNVGLIANCFLVNICDLHVKFLPSWSQPQKRHCEYHISQSSYSLMLSNFCLQTAFDTNRLRKGEE
ncbi:unnamed protein product [Cylicostephanus goldi]|uniref:Apoptosis inhibitory protein 5 n=1 Tax=Cylicostephanus goldi TaxID=71465 RepID=A0A3P7LU68_CYLGO|nr:unnamed protein product [Cylicostephanus goldi]